MFCLHPAKVPLAEVSIGVEQQLEQYEKQLKVLHALLAAPAGPERDALFKAHNNGQLCKVVCSIAEKVYIIWIFVRAELVLISMLNPLLLWSFYVWQFGVLYQKLLMQFIIFHALLFNILMHFCTNLNCFEFDKFQTNLVKEILLDSGSSGSCH